MYPYIALGLTILGLALSYIYAQSVMDDCREELRANMPLNEWISFNEAVRIGKSTRLITRVCLHYLIRSRRIKVRLSEKLEKHFKKRVAEIIQNLPPEILKKGVLIPVTTGFRHLPELEFMLSVRPNAPRKVEEPVEVPDFALPQAI